MWGIRHRTVSYFENPTPPLRIKLENSGPSSAAFASEVVLGVFLSAGGYSPPLTNSLRSYIISSILPFNRMRQSRLVFTFWTSATDPAMLVVQLLVNALYHSGCTCRLLARCR